MAPLDTQTQLETLLLELQMTEERIFTGEVKPENVKQYLTRLEAIRDAYAPLVVQVAEEGTPVSKDDRIGFLRHITADLDTLENLKPPQGLSTVTPHQSGEKGIKIKGKWLNNLRFTDDIVLINGNIQELRLMAEELCKESEKVGLAINLTKRRRENSQ